MTNISPKMARRALVTGGATRIGRAIVTALAEHGFDVAIHCLKNTQAASELAREVTQKNVKACVLRADLAQHGAVQTLIERAQKALGGPLGVLVNNASVFDYDDWQSASIETWQHHMRVNVRAPFFLTQAFARAHIEGTHAMVLNMIDQRVWSLTPHFMTYTLSKSALWTMTQTMALALAPQKIRVNAIGPGPTMASARQTQTQFVRQYRAVPLGYGASASEIGRGVISFLTLPSVTGQMLAMDGAQHMQWAPRQEGEEGFHE